LVFASPVNIQDFPFLFCNMLNIILKDAIHPHSDTLWYAVKAEKGSHALKIFTPLRQPMRF